MNLFMDIMDQYRPTYEVDQVDRYTYRWAFSGADIHAYIGNRKVANLVALSVSINREVAPIYTFGDPSPRTFVKGKRGIAGTMTFTQFDRHALLEGVFGSFDRIGQIWENIDKLYERMSDEGQFKERVQKLLQLAGGSAGYNNPNYNPSYSDPATLIVARAAHLVASRHIQYVDQLPPFDLTLVFINESGAFAYMALLGVQFANEGYGYTLDDLSSATAVTYVATGVRPLTNKLDTLVKNVEKPSAQQVSV